MPSQETEKIERDIRNLQDDFENFQYIVNKKIGPGSSKIPTSSIPGARQYDAVVDVNGQGDFKTIQEALDAGRSRIYVRAGTYAVDTTIVLNRDNILIQGESQGSTIINGEGVTNIIEIGTEADEVSNIQIRNIQFEYTAGTAGADDVAIFIYKCENLSILSCSFVRCRYCVYSYYSGPFQSTCENGLLSNCNFDNCYASYAGYGGAGFINNIKITNNYFFGVDNLIMGQARGSFISGNVFRACKSLYTGSYNIINNNVFDSMTDDCIVADESANGVLISNNYFLNCLKNGIVLESAFYPQVLGNHFNRQGQGSNNTYSCIILGLASDTSFGIKYTVVSNNHIHSNHANKPKYGIAEESNKSDYNLITGNIVQNAVTTNIYIQGANTIVGDNIS